MQLQMIHMNRTGTHASLCRQYLKDPEHCTYVDISGITQSQVQHKGHLLVQAAQELQVAVRQPARKVAWRAVS